MIARLLPAFLALVLAAGCSPKPDPADAAAAAAGLTRVRMQTDWYAQAEHGGHYQAAARGFYREAGLEVDILVGGPGAFGQQKVMTGAVEFSMTRSDDLIVNVEQGLPVVMIAGFMQRDPQALLLHEENPISSFAELDNKAVMATPGANWIAYIQARHGIRLNLIPLNYGLGSFMVDPNFIQQCFITNEPFYVRANGKRPKTLLIADSGYNPYRVLFTSRDFAQRQPDVVRRFVAATLRGWEDYLTGDPAPGNALILPRNEKMTPEFLAFSIQSMREHRLVLGDPAKGERTGLLTRRRIQEQIDLLRSLGILKAPLRVEDVARFDFLPPDLQELAEK